MDAHEDKEVLEVMRAPLSVQRERLAQWGYGDVGLLMLMSACDGGCFFCASDDVVNPPDRLITTMASIEQWLDCAPPPELLLAGSEPMSHRDFFPTLELIRNRGDVKVDLITSGLRIDSQHVAERLYDFGVRQISLPIYSDNEVEHDEIVGVAGHLERVRRGMEYAQNGGLEVRVHTLALRRNIDSIADLALWVLAKTGHHLTVAPLREKTPLFSYRQEGVAFEAIEDRLSNASVVLTGFPLCVAPSLPRGGSTVVRLYFQCQSRVLAPSVCSHCSRNNECMGIVPAQLRAFGAGALQPFPLG
ncbi:MAG: radical SAM protein [Myxococcota bacterium]|nr:radical SAM protein [Myxococcota bacterium]